MLARQTKTLGSHAHVVSTVPAGVVASKSHARVVNNELAVDVCLVMQFCIVSEFTQPAQPPTTAGLSQLAAVLAETVS